MKTAKLTKAVIPVAGLGTRLLPLTKAQPKEMLPVVDKPAIQYVVEEAVAAGIESVLMVTGRGKRAIEDYFDYAIELEHELEVKGRKAELEQVRRISDLVQVFYVRQKLPRGLGDAILQAKAFVGGETFAVLLADDIIDTAVPVLKQMEAVHRRYPGILVGVMKVAASETASYGIIGGTQVAPGVWEVSRLVEKPSSREAPSNLGIVGRYILPPTIFSALEHTRPGKGGEVQLTDAMEAMLSSGHVYAYEFQGTRYDVGDKLGLLKASVALALKRPDLGTELQKFLDSIRVESGARSSRTVP
jgi:UTP--glucose-1-phosphate uridylyltransferase